MNDPIFFCCKCGKVINTKNDLHAPYYVYSDMGIELGGPLCHEDWITTTQAVIDFKMNQMRRAEDDKGNSNVYRGCCS